MTTAWLSKMHIPNRGGTVCSQWADASCLFSAEPHIEMSGFFKSRIPLPTQCSDVISGQSRPFLKQCGASHLLFTDLITSYAFDDYVYRVEY